MAVRPIDGTWSKFVWNLGEKSESLARKFREGKACFIDLRLAVDAQPTLTPPNELTCEGCIYEKKGHENCNYCMRASWLNDYYFHPSKGENFNE